MKERGSVCNLEKASSLIASSTFMLTMLIQYTLKNVPMPRTAKTRGSREHTASSTAKCMCSGATSRAIMS